MNNGTIQRRRRAKPEPYSQTTITPYKQDFENLLVKPKYGFGPRPAGSIDESEWQEIFDELREQGLAYSRVANIKAARFRMLALNVVTRGSRSMPEPEAVLISPSAAST